jgi:hypothetical protein
LALRVLPDDGAAVGVVVGGLDRDRAAFALQDRAGLVQRLPDDVGDLRDRRAVEAARIGLTHALLLAADYGVSQRRTCTIVIGSRIGCITHPLCTHTRIPTLIDTVSWHTIRDAIGALPERPITTELPAARTTFFGERFLASSSGSTCISPRRAAHQ